MIRMPKKDKVGLNLISVNFYDANTEVRVPATIGRRPRIEEDGSLLLFNQGEMTVAEKHTVDLACPSLDGNALCGSPSMPVNSCERLVANSKARC